MRFRVVRDTRLFDRVGGNRIDFLTTNEVVTATGKTDGAFMEVDIGDTRTGWVLKEDCVPVSSDDRPPLDVGMFVRACIEVERAFNAAPKTAPWFVAADALVARALIETDLKNSGPRLPNSDAAGPLQVSSAEWKRFLKDGGALARDFGLAEFDSPISQIRGAAFRLTADARSLSERRAAAGQGSAGDPYVPSYLDLLVAYLVDDIGAGAALIEAEAGAAAATRSIGEVLASELPADRVRALFDSRERFLGEPAENRTVKAFMAAVETILAEALKKAFDLMAEHAPDELPRIKQGEAPWMEIAESELAAGVREPNPRIKEYFKATDFGPGATATTHWCGAFVAHCLKSCGSAEAAASIPKMAAGAANWKGWGRTLPLESRDIPQGAVVVFKPGDGSGGSGHVAFFSGYDDMGRMLVLGGNQSDQVSRTHMGLQVTHIGWLDLATEAFAEQFRAEGTSARTISDRAFNLIVELEVSNKPNYELRLRGPTWPGQASGVTIGIGYDVGHTPVANLRADWANFIPDNMIKALEGASGVTGPLARELADKLAKKVDVPWDSAIKVHRTMVMPRWIRIVETALANTNELSEHSLGALVSLTYNRGPSFNSGEDRHREMRNIRDHMRSRQFDLIPNEIRAMKRLWPTSKGLRDRRETEARFFEVGQGR